VLQVPVLVPKGRRIVAQGGASDSGHARNPGETEEVMSAPGGAAETQYDPNIRAGLPSPFPGLSARGFSPTQGSASLHPGLEVLRPSRAEGRATSPCCDRFFPPSATPTIDVMMGTLITIGVPMGWQLITRWQQKRGQKDSLNAADFLSRLPVNKLAKAHFQLNRFSSVSGEDSFGVAIASCCCAESAGIALADLL
jgi:hypothetical protein